MKLTNGELNKLATIKVYHPWAEYVARDKDGTLAIFDHKPIRYNRVFNNNSYKEWEYIDLSLPSVTWEDSRVNIKEALDNEPRESRWKGEGMEDCLCPLCDETPNDTPNYCIKCGAKISNTDNINKGITLEISVYRASGLWYTSDIVKCDSDMWIWQAEYLDFLRNNIPSNITEGYIVVRDVGENQKFHKALYTYEELFNGRK